MPPLSNAPLKPADIIRDVYGFWTHPDLPMWDEDTKKEEIDKWLLENNGSFHFEMMDGDAPQELLDRYFEEGESDCSYWHPFDNRPGSFLVSIHDTEDGPVAMYFVPNSSKAMLDVIAERQRQISAEGWTLEHDDKYQHGVLAFAASCYCLASVFPNSSERENVPSTWPFAGKFWKPTTPRRDLVKAAALILAEIERLDRKADKEAA
ncbi:hypothetical protein PY479_05065 [Shewanella sp. A32]|uniref:hypothetical protein n=1 Tax=Shewanella sp. A32 TaxID=3031327 RepID=UPI0023BA11E9|nr:hypothetical protein [Shewanella sp. A32]MDF0533649.1 hypothetical protein [Shewanella sp. A32]